MLKNIIIWCQCFYHAVFVRTVHPILIVEYLPRGDLLGYMRKSRGINDKYYCGEGQAQELTTYDLVTFSKQIATGMVFLGSRGVSGCSQLI